MFGGYNNNGYGSGVSNPTALMQQRLGAYGNGMQQGYNMPSTYQQNSFGQNNFQGIKGRIVTNADEVKAAPIDLDGSITFFPCPAENCIYAKSIDLNGGALLQKFVLEQPKQQPQYAEVAALQQLTDRVIKLENYLKGGNDNVQSNTVTEQSNPINGAAAE